ncbi:glycoside hydrolase family 2 [Erysipelothrix sp. HDW6A]|uniref:glycoside hydrolase family 2 protein n=1 Tax=Erysipelothrix sp. HDW6A TaxID=2714928 RepID=UPI00140DF4BF|nr:sugar-binding domain-containing protein [Erysipelothrix sp. HDW6A]QIK56880.1 glycoside hydrolase family 2 [Erysipelothrix sp. HDW6A]
MYVTPWFDSINNKPLQEYPRPQLVRNSYISLNGYWDFEVNKLPLTSTYSKSILVPFSPETVASGLAMTINPDDFMHYRRFFTLSDDFMLDRVLLNFEAVDQECYVYVNTMKVGTHIGGYDSFSIDITDFIRPGNNELVVRVVDQTEKSGYVRGKQKLNNKGKMSSIFYTPNSGIWQSVWLESVPNNYVKHVDIAPNFDDASFDITIHSLMDDYADVHVFDKFGDVRTQTLLTNQKHTLELLNFTSWCPDNPHLYDVTITLEDDVVNTYFGMRKFSKTIDSHGVSRFTLNNKPFFFLGILDQGYWPESLLTAPSDEALIFDIETMKDLGFNTLRKHVKVESSRFYYHCDRIGMVVWQDMPNGGGVDNPWFATYLPNVSTYAARNVKDNHHWLFKRKDRKAKEFFYMELDAMIQQLKHFPSIAVWVPFNEGWGQFDAPVATKRILDNDPSRLINEACGWYDQGGGDVFSIHNYLRRLHVKPQGERVVSLTEYGGYAFPIKDHVMYEESFGYKYYKTLDEYEYAIQDLVYSQIIPNIKSGLSTTIYTQLSDVEKEINGLVTYDRRVIKTNKELIRKLNQDVINVFNEIQNIF